MENDTRWYVLGTAILVLLAIVVPRFLHLRSYSDREAHEVCQAIYSQVKSFQAQAGSEADWVSLEDEAIPQLEIIAADIEAHLDGKTPASTAIYQLAKHDLPRTIQNRGLTSGTNLDDGLGRIAQLIEASGKMSVHDVKNRDAHPKSAGGWDPLIASMLVLDGLLLMVGIAFAVGRFHNRSPAI